MQLAWFLAKRFIFIADKKNSINSMVVICFWGILISTFALALVSAIMQGFEQATHAKLQGIHADITLSAQGKPLKYNELHAFITKRYKDTVAALTPQTSAPAMLRGQDDTTLPILVSLTGIKPETEVMVTTLATYLQEPKNKSIAELVTQNSLLIGYELAQQLQSVIGDTIDVYTASEEKSSRTKLALVNS